MLRQLGIKNYALIESVELEFGRGLTVITGETGSGKSIMMGALSLLLGNRADSRVATGGKARVEARFEDADESMHALFDARGIDWVESETDGKKHNEITIRREIAPEGRSRVFINDTPVTLATLAEIGPKLIYIHSQHANAALSDNAEQLRMVDVFADNGAEREAYHKAFREFVALKKSIAELRNRQAKSRENEEFLRFQYEQLDKLKPRRGELAAIERRYEVLSDADEIKENLTALCQLLGDGDNGLAAAVADARARLAKIDLSLFGKNALDASIPERMEALQTEITDIGETIEDINAQVDTDPAALEKLSERMKAYYDAVKHFHVADADELVDLYTKIGNELAGLDGEDGELPRLEKLSRQKARALKGLADALTATRRKGAAVFGQLVLDAARTLGLPNLRFEVELAEGKLTSSGQDKVEFMCSFNRQGDMRPVGDTASGGEMSRLMLSIKAVMADRMNMPSIVFDEVDTGVSGEIAERMGRMMRGMGGHMQVMAITHLPQVAAQGSSHFKVFKKDEENRTVTHVEALGVEDRVREIAAMISGSEVTPAALDAAKALMREAGTAR